MFTIHPPHTLRSAAVFFAIVTTYLPHTSYAHPHAWITVNTTITIDEHNQVTSLTETWLFDAMYSAYAAQDLHADATHLTQADLRNLATTNVQNLKDFDYFTLVQDAHGHRATFAQVTNIEGYTTNPSPEDAARISILASHTQKIPHIAMRFTLSLAQPLSATGQGVSYKIYDPTYYTDMAHSARTPVTIIGPDNRPASHCRATIDSPNLSSTLISTAASLDKQATAPDNLGASFAQKVTILCSN